MINFWTIKENRTWRKYCLSVFLAACLISGFASIRLSATDLAGTGPVTGSFIALGTDYDYNSTLGNSVRLFAGGQWQPLSWLRLLAGARFTAREAWPWVEATASNGWIIYPDAQFIEAVVQSTDDLGLNLGLPILNGGLRIHRMAVPGTTASYLSISPYNTFDFKWIYLRAGFAFRWWLDGVSDPVSQFEIQTLGHLGLRLFLGRDDLYLRLEANTDTDFESANIQAVGYELALVWPLAPHWQAQIDFGLRPAGGFSLAATNYRTVIGCVVRVLP